MLCALICNEGCHIYRNGKEGTVLDALNSAEKAKNVAQKESFV